jgi:hypothetical protein
MLNDPEMQMLFARERQEELRRMMQDVPRSPFRRLLGVLWRPARAVVQPLRPRTSHAPQGVGR